MELKRKTLFISFILVFCINLNAQSDLGFAPVGAKWHYNTFVQTLGGGTRGGHISYEVVKDTIINGKISKEVTFSGNQVIPTIGLTNPFYLHYDSNRVYWLNKMTGIFDLLYDFNAEVGDSWTIKLQCDSSDYPWLVTDTMTFTVNAVYYDTINGIPLKRLNTTTSPASSVNGYSNYRISEYIGGITVPFPHNYNCSGIGIHTWMGDLRCYEDGKFGLFSRRNPCAAPISSLEEELNKSQISISPNPANRNIIIESSQLMEEISVSNLAGEVLINSKQRDLTHHLNTTILVPGMYFVSILLEGGRIRTKKIIIQK